MFNDWELTDGRTIRLLTPLQLTSLPAGTKVFSINGEEAITGQGDIDVDTRFGYTAWGQLIDAKAK